MDRGDLPGNSAGSEAPSTACAAAPPPSSSTVARAITTSPRGPSTTSSKCQHDPCNGSPAGIGAHKPEALAKAMEEQLDVDFYMCCYYNPTSRDDNPEHVRGAKEWFHELTGSA